MRKLPVSPRGGERVNCMALPGLPPGFWNQKPPLAAVELRLGKRLASGGVFPAILHTHIGKGRMFGAIGLAAHCRSRAEAKTLGARLTDGPAAGLGTGAREGPHHASGLGRQGQDGGLGCGLRLLAPWSNGKGCHGLGACDLGPWKVGCHGLSGAQWRQGWPAAGGNRARRRGIPPDRARPCRQIEAMCLADHSILRDAHATPDFGGGMTFGPKGAQAVNGLVCPVHRIQSPVPDTTYSSEREG